MKGVWYLPASLVAIVILLLTTARIWSASHFARAPVQYPSALSSLLSPQTIRALDQDQTLQDAVVSFTEAIAATSEQLGRRFELEQVKAFGLDLTAATTHIRKVQDQARTKRGLLDDLGSAFQNLIGGGGGNGGAPLGLNLTEGLSGIFSGLGDKLVGSLATPALFLGIGLGMGASSGLNLTDMQSSNAQAVKVANTYNASATGLNLVAQNLGSGLAGQISPALGNSNVSFGPVAFALASGIGNATAYGLNLTQEKTAPSNGSDIEAIAGNLGLGITTPIVSNIDLKGLMSNVGGGGASALMKQLPDIAAAAGKGLGEGARDGLGFTKSPSSKNRKRQEDSGILAGVDIPGTVGSFTKGLSQSFLTNSDFSKLNLTSGVSNIDIKSMLRPLAAGAGTGIGMGIAVGLKLKDPNAQPMFGGNITGDDANTALIAEGFVQNLLSNFLVNSTALDKGKELLSSNQPGLLKDVSGAKAAEGFARGFIEGAASAMSSVGGLKNLIDGNVPSNAMENVPVLEPSKFDDSTNGTATGFARGLSGPGTILVAEVIRNLTGGTRNATAPQSSKRSLGGEIGVVHLASVARRQSNTSAPGTPFPIAIDSATIQLGAQKAVDFLTCSGIGGLTTVAQGALKGGATKLLTGDKSAGSLDPRVLQSLPSDPIILTSEGNQFKIVLRDLSIEINNMPFRKFTILTALHVLFSSLAFLAFLPLYIIWGVILRFSVLAGFPINEAKNKNWRMGFVVAFTIFAVTGIVLGMAGMGSAQHFTDAHGIFGLVSLLLLLPTAVLTFIRLRTTVSHPTTAAFRSVKSAITVAKSPQRIYLISGILTNTLLTLGQITFGFGFDTLRSISLCLVDSVLNAPVAVMLTSIVLMLQISATALIGIRMWLEQHIAKREAAGNTKLDPGFEIEGRRSSIKTFGFDRKTPPAPLNFMFKHGKKQPDLPQRNTEELKGFEDVAIGTPFNVKKEGSEVSLVDQARMYDPKTSGYHAFQEGRSPVEQEGPKTMNVSTRDLWPPPKDEAGRAR